MASLEAPVRCFLFVLCHRFAEFQKSPAGVLFQELAALAAQERWQMAVLPVVPALASLVEECWGEEEEEFFSSSLQPRREEMSLRAHVFRP